LSTNLKENEVTEDWFLKLKEYDSLLKMRTSHIQSVKAQEDRITKLRCQHDDGLLRTEKLRQELSGLQQRMFELEGTLKTAQEQKNRLRDLGGDENKIKSYEQQIETLETEGLSLLEAIE